MSQANLPADTIRHVGPANGCVIVRRLADWSFCARSRTRESTCVSGVAAVAKGAEPRRTRTGTSAPVHVRRGDRQPRWQPARKLERLFRDRRSNRHGATCSKQSGRGATGAEGGTRTHDFRLRRPRFRPDSREFWSVDVHPVLRGPAFHATFGSRAGSRIGAYRRAFRAVTYRASQSSNDGTWPVRQLVGEVEGVALASLTVLTQAEAVGRGRGRSARDSTPRGSVDKHLRSGDCTVGVGVRDVAIDTGWSLRPTAGRL
jgi:hypothetical protein